MKDRRTKVVVVGGGAGASGGRGRGRREGKTGGRAGGNKQKNGPAFVVGTRRGLKHRGHRGKEEARTVCSVRDRFRAARLRRAQSGRWSIMFQSTIIWKCSS